LEFEVFGLTGDGFLIVCLVLSQSALETIDSNGVLTLLVFQFVLMLKSERLDQLLGLVFFLLEIILTLIKLAIANFVSFFEISSALLEES